MSNNKHLITPPPEMVQQLADGPGTWLEKITKAYRAGADEELEACCEWLDKGPYGFSIAASTSDLTGSLRTARRPESMTRKQQGLEILRRLLMEAPHIDATPLQDILASLPDDC